MNTVQKNFSLTEGARSRVVVKLPEDVDPNNYEVFAGNDKCKLRHFVYGDVEYGDHFISLVSEPAPQAGYPLPYQIFIKDKVSNVEWLLVTGQVTILSRVVGTPGIACEEINASLTEEIIEITIYSKEDLDEAVKRALEAAEDAEFWAKRSMAWAEGDPGSTSHSSMYWASIASDAATAAECYKNAVIAAKDEAINAKEAACQSAATALEYMNSAHDYALDAQSHANCANIFAENATHSAQDAANYSSMACLYKQQTCEYLDEVRGIAARKQDKLTAGRNIVITKSGDDTFICALGGGGEGGDVYTDRPNNFLECNVFDANVSLKSGAEFPYCASDYRTQYKLTNMNGDLYWGCSKLNDQASAAGNVYTHRENYFVCENIFDKRIELRGGAEFPYCGSDYREQYKLKNYNGDLYWGNCKLNGQGGGAGGDVYTDRPNRFLCGDNTFDYSLKLKQGAEIPLCGTADFRGQYKLTNYCGDLYWGCSKLNDQGGGSGGGDVYTNRQNQFLCWNDFRGFTSFGANVDANQIDANSLGLYNQCGNAHYLTARRESGEENLYWNGVKLNNQGGGAGGDVYTDRQNTFECTNTFNNPINLRQGAGFPLCDTDFRGQYKLTNYCGNLYWGCCKLNGQGGGSTGGDVYTNRPNTFVCTNRFNSNTEFNGNADFNGYSVFESGKIGINNQYNNAHYFTARLEGGVENLYWNGVKLNNQGGGGDVYTDRNNNFTAENTFNGNVKFNSVPALNCGVQFVDCGVDKRGNGILSVLNNDLYWGNCKLNNQGGGSTGGDVYTDRNNNFTGVNTFNAITNLNSARINDNGDSPCENKLTNHHGDLYWGNCRLNNQISDAGDVYTDRNNNFTAENTFNDDTTFNGDVYFNNNVEFDAVKVKDVGSDNREVSKLTNYNGDLYWGNCKINSQAGFGAGDVYTNRNNNLTGVNTFTNNTVLSSVVVNDSISVPNNGDHRLANNLSNYNGDLYWGNCKLNNQASVAGDVYTNRHNTLLCENDFIKTANFYGGAILPYCARDYRQTYKLSNMCGDLYWGNCKLNNQAGSIQAGDVYTDRQNRFLMANCFIAKTNFAKVFVNDCGDSRELNTLTNMGGDLYWGNSKLNNQISGAGDVYTNRNNVLTGTNTFQGDVNFNWAPAMNYGIQIVDCDVDIRESGKLTVFNNDLYWGTCKLNGQGEVTPAFITLTPNTEIKHDKRYIAQPVSGATDYSNLTIEQFATAEIWFDITASMQITLPSDWSWVDEIEPPFQARNRYLVEVRSDGYAIIAELKLSYNY